MRSARWVLSAGLAFAATAAFAVYTPGAGITGTPHDWATDGAGNTKTTSVYQWLDSKGNITTYNTGTPYIDPTTGVQGKTTLTIGLCTKCHTPHQAKSTNLLWNHTLTTNTFTWDQPATTAGTTYPSFKGDTYKGPTTKCLSCHDGSLASTDGIWFNRQVISGAKYVAAPGSLDSGHEVASSTGNMSGTHPVAMPYPYGNVSNTYNGTFNGSATIWAEFIGDPQADGIRLFNDAANDGVITAGALAGKTGIECTSCHDVHNGAQTKDLLLLRGMNSGGTAQGYLCTKCHAK
jgi:hypothetical protein